MQAVVQTAYGGAEALELRTVPRPTAGAGEVLVRVHATGVNDQDWALLAGKPFFVRLFGKHRGRILGADVAGEVVEVGAGVTASPRATGCSATCPSTATAVSPSI